MSDMEYEDIDIERGRRDVVDTTKEKGAQSLWLVTLIISATLLIQIMSLVLTLYNCLSCEACQNSTRIGS